MATEHQVVFFSLHGEDVPDEDPIYLKYGLERSGISVFKRINTGSEDRRTVLNKIWDSSFVLVIFSVRFAKSSKCLDELVLVKKRMDIGKLSMIPIFYKVEPRDVIHVEGSFGSMLQILEMEEHRAAMWNSMDALLRTEVRLKNWREALVSITAIKDFIYREEDDFIEKITKQVNKAYAKDDQTIGNQLAMMPQITVKERMEALVSDLRSMGLVFDGNVSWESDSIDYLSEQLKTQLSKLISDEAKKKEGANPIPVYEKSEEAHNQVFISFQGKEVRMLLSHLLNGLARNRINAVTDIPLERGSSPYEVISQVIKDSGIALVFLSKSYAESRWCWEELLVIKKYMDEGMLKVIPIFYDVKPHDVMRQEGDFGDCFRETTRSFDEAKILACQEALRSVGERMGIVYDSKNSRSEFLTDVIAVIMQLLSDVSPKP